MWSDRVECVEWESKAVMKREISLIAKLASPAGSVVAIHPSSRRKNHNTPT